MSIPPEFIERLGAELGAATARQIVATMSQPKRTAYWINPLREGTLPRFGEAMEGLEGVMACAGRDRQEVTRHPAASAGRIYPINPSSAVAVAALMPCAGEEVLDLAAAPGGKTILIAARMQNRGRLAAVEPVRKRYFRLRSNLARCGVTIAPCYRDDGRRTGDKTPGRFDRVLLDAPCSSEARFRADAPKTTRHWSRRKTAESARKQRALLASAFQCLKPGGTLVYCTCAFSRSENEDVVTSLLDSRPAATLAPFEFPAAPGGETNLPGALRILPDDRYDGFFIAVIGKNAA